MHGAFFDKANFFIHLLQYHTQIYIVYVYKSIFLSRPLLQFRSLDTTLYSERFYCSNLLPTHFGHEHLFKHRYPLREPHAHFSEQHKQKIKDLLYCLYNIQ